VVGLNKEVYLAGNIALFSGGLTDDDKWKYYPALLAFQPPGPVVDITEYLTMKYGRETGTNYDSLQHKFTYTVEGITNAQISIRGSRTNTAFDYTKITLKESELTEWIRLAKLKSKKHKYDGSTYLTPE
jgi:hypothetical protein